MTAQTSFLDRRRSELHDGEQAVPLTFEDLRAEAKRVLGPGPFDAVAAAAGTGEIIRENERALADYRILPRVLRGASPISITTDFLGTEVVGPVSVAPVGGLEAFHEGGELAAARAANEVGVPMIMSNAATATIEDVAGAMSDAPTLFQLYWPKEWDVAASYLERAEAAGCAAVVLTVDGHFPRWTTRSLESDYTKGDVVSQQMPRTDPVVQELADRADQSVEGFLASGALAKDRSLTWEDLSFIREHTDLPLLLKGILHPEDAQRAAELADGVIVSNHGGNQIHGGVTAATALPRIVDVIGDSVPVWFDSGVRGGADIFKAIALGADGVLLGRPYVYGLAIAGERGVREVLENYLAELESVLGLSGHASTETVGRDAIASHYFTEA